MDVDVDVDASGADAALAGTVGLDDDAVAVDMDELSGPLTL